MYKGMHNFDFIHNYNFLIISNFKKQKTGGGSLDLDLQFYLVSINYQQ